MGQSFTLGMGSSIQAADARAKKWIPEMLAAKPWRASLMSKLKKIYALSRDAQTKEHLGNIHVGLSSFMERSPLYFVNYSYLIRVPHKAIWDTNPFLDTQKKITDEKWEEYVSFFHSTVNAHFREIVREEERMQTQELRKLFATTLTGVRLEECFAKAIRRFEVYETKKRELKAWVKEALKDKLKRELWGDEAKAFGKLLEEKLTDAIEDPLSSARVQRELKAWLQEKYDASSGGSYLGISNLVHKLGSYLKSNKEPSLMEAFERVLNEKFEQALYAGTDFKKIKEETLEKAATALADNRIEHIRFKQEFARRIKCVIKTYHDSQERIRCVQNWFEQTLETKDAMLDQDAVKRRVIAITIQLVTKRTEYEDVSKVLNQAQQHDIFEILEDGSYRCLDRTAVALYKAELEVACQRALDLTNPEEKEKALVSLGICSFIQSVIECDMRGFSSGNGKNDEPLEDFLYHACLLAKIIDFGFHGTGMKFDNYAMKRSLDDVLKILFDASTEQRLRDFFREWKPWIKYCQDKSESEIEAEVTRKLAEATDTPEKAKVIYDAIYEEAKGEFAVIRDKLTEDGKRVRGKDGKLLKERVERTIEQIAEAELQGKLLEKWKNEAIEAQKKEAEAKTLEALLRHGILTKQVYYPLPAGW
tara:strand:- start:2820 stop:4763 length:1944 start_codon:yes stop_codon:yes gene_type:complete